jgi:uncharacterized protein
VHVLAHGIAVLRILFLVAGKFYCLMHSIAGIVIFYGIGFGWDGRVSLTIALAGCVAFYALQIVLSRVWLSAAQFGPVEWLWRLFKYRRSFALFR